MLGLAPAPVQTGRQRELHNGTTFARQARRASGDRGRNASRLRSFPGSRATAARSGPAIFSPLCRARAPTARDFIADAVRRGAVAVLGRPELRRGCRTPGRRVHRRRKSARQAGPYGGGSSSAPSPMSIAAVTGTNGKTSVAVFLRQIWARAGPVRRQHGNGRRRGAGRGHCAHAHHPRSRSKSTACWPDLKKDGVDHLALEASSHGLDQHRLDGVASPPPVSPTSPAITSIIMPTFAHYLAAKLRLFSELVRRRRRGGRQCRCRACRGFRRRGQGAAASTVSPSARAARR